MPSKYIAFALILMPALALAAENTQPAPGSTYFSNALFITLLVLIIALLAVIAALGQVLKNIAGSDYILAKLVKERSEGNSSGQVKNLSIIIFTLLTVSASAANASGGSEKWKVGGLDMLTFFIMVGIILCECAVIYTLYISIMSFVKRETPAKAVAKPKAKTILEKMNASVEIEKEKDILLDHNYDGIKELDNNLPPWWKYGFYVTIVFACIYLVNYHVARTGDLQDVEYEKSLVKAKAEVEAFMRSAANNVDETNVKMLGAGDLASGRDLFTATCATCHGKEGQGGVGPNLTDGYWLHGGSLSEIFKSIKYGWGDKGMKAWKEDLSPVQIAQLTSYIKSIKGSNPAGAKAPQGDLYQEEPLPLDSTNIKTDTLAIPKDTVK